MASILEKYNQEIKDSKFTGYIKTPADLTPYSIGSGTGLATVDTKLIDETAIKGLETKLGVNRYGSGTLADTSDAKNYSQVVKKD